jgi:4-hydroxy-2-oxoheptanedioate aldolase
MKINIVKQRMLEGKPAIGIVSVSGSPLMAEALSHAGFDFVLLDNQHGLWNDDTGWLAFRSIISGPAVPMARVGQNDFGAIGRLLDRGALGLVVPMVESVEQARAAANAVRYPPQGNRSYGPILAQYHGGDYDSWIDHEVFLAVQIESAKAVEYVEDILAVDGVDGCWIGPLDLARTMGVDLRTMEGTRAHEQAILHVLDACRATRKIPGIHGLTTADAHRRLEQGFLFVTAGVDMALLSNGAQDALRQLGRLP